jgi:hypothetical protein
MTAVVLAGCGPHATIEPAMTVSTIITAQPPVRAPRRPFPDCAIATHPLVRSRFSRAQR